MKASVLALALLCAGAAFAQTPSPPASPMAAKHMDDLATLLDLTDAQKVQVQAILQEQHAQMKASFENAKASGTKPDWQQMQALHQQLEQQTLQKLQTVNPPLSAAQLKKFQIITEHMHHAHGMRHGPAGGAAPTTPSPQG